VNVESISDIKYIRISITDLDFAARRLGRTPSSQGVGGAARFEGVKVKIPGINELK
jgi:hypothetical protein